MPTLADIDLTVCVCCDRREREIDYIRYVCKMIGLPVQIFIGGNGKNPRLRYDFIDPYEGTEYGSNRRNQYWFHKYVIGEVYKLAPRNVLFLEDDVTLTWDFWHVLNRVEMPLEWDQINIGGFDDTNKNYHHYDADAIHSPYLVRTNSLGGMYGSLVNGKNLRAMHEEARFDGVHGACDDMIGKDSSGKYRKYFLHPPVVIERHIPSICLVKLEKRGLYYQALEEGRLFSDDAVYGFSDIPADPVQ